MMRRSIRLLFVLCIWIATGCGRSGSAKFNEEAELFARPDKTIDSSEYRKLLDFIRNTHDGRFKSLFTDGNDGIDNQKVRKYLLAVFEKYQIPINPDDIWQPGKGGKPASLNVNLYLDRSLSMDGYSVDGNNSMKNTLSRILADSKHLPGSTKVNLGNITDRLSRIKGDADIREITEFCHHPEKTAPKEGTTGSTDVAKMLKMLLDSVDDNNLDIFVSDCVFSPGKQDADSYLQQQQLDIQNYFQDKLSKKPDLSVLILQCLAPFKGAYYDHLNKRHAYIEIQNRPYYIWFIGTSNQIRLLLDNQLFVSIKYEHKIVLQSSNSPFHPEYNILYRDKIGEFHLPDASGPISKAQSARDPEHKGRFGFDVIVNFANGIQDDLFYLDSGNYKVSGNYSVSVEKIGNNINRSNNVFTHKLKLQTANLQPGLVSIQVIGKSPSWVGNSSSSNDIGIDRDVDEQQKTYGLSYLITGVCDAFYPPGKPNAIEIVDIKIDKH